MGRRAQGSKEMRRGQCLRHDEWPCRAEGLVWRLPVPNSARDPLTFLAKASIGRGSGFLIWLAGATDRYAVRTWQAKSVQRTATALPWTGKPPHGSAFRARAGSPFVQATSSVHPICTRSFATAWQRGRRLFHLWSKLPAS